MQKTHAVGIDLGTTYSCISYLNEHGEPVTIPNEEGELNTPSAVMFEEGGEVTVGTEALRNSILHPDRVVMDSKRCIGNARKFWEIAGRRMTPVDIAAYVLKKLLRGAELQIGPIEQAVITVPAQFSDFQRHATIEAGHRAGLQKVDIINEPVAAALCHVLGTEGLWFTELAEEQRILVYDLGGGTFDLSLVAYRKEEVRVIASAGDLELGGIDWTRALVEVIARQFAREFKVDPRDDLESYQFLSLEAEQAKRSLTVRPKAALTCQHEGFRKTYQVEQGQFDKMCKSLLERTVDVTRRLLKDNRMGWAHVDSVLTTGGSSRMPMVRKRLKEISGRTLNTSLSPDQSISHGATYYAGMLLTNNKFARSILSAEATERLSRIRQTNVNARSLGILVRDVKSRQRVPYYLLPANTTLPASVSHTFGTVVPNQRRVNIQIVESGTDESKPAARLGNCVIDDLPVDLPEGSEIEVTIRYDEQARVHVSACEKATGKQATTEIVRHENISSQLATDQHVEEDFALSTGKSPSPGQRSEAVQHVSPPSKPGSAQAASAKALPRPATVAPPAAQPPAMQPPAIQAAASKPAVAKRAPVNPSNSRPPVAKPTTQKAPPPVRSRPAPPPNASSASSKKPKPRAIPSPPALTPLSRPPGELDEAVQPVPLCDRCGDEALNAAGVCPRCGARPADQAASAAKSKSRRSTAGRQQAQRRAKSQPQAKSKRKVKHPAPPIDDGEILDLSQTSQSRGKSSAKPTSTRSAKPAKRKSPPPQSPSADSGEDEFWQLVDD